MRDAAPHKVTIALRARDLLTQRTSARRFAPDWSLLAHLTRVGTSLAGQATVRIRLAQPERAVVYAIAPSGKRLEEVPAKVESGELVVTLQVAGPDGKARLAYEIVAE